MTKMDNEAYMHYWYCNTNSDISTPEKFLYKKWGIWEETFINRLKTKIKVTNLPISYVIHKYTTPLTMDHSGLIIYNASFNTGIFKAEIRKVANILTHIVLDTDAFEWGGRKFTQSKGRERWLYLVSNYN